MSKLTINIFCDYCDEVTQRHIELSDMIGENQYININGLCPYHSQYREDLRGFMFRIDNDNSEYNITVD